VLLPVLFARNAFLVGHSYAWLRASSKSLQTKLWRNHATIYELCRPVPGTVSATCENADVENGV
jgi:hypothetical protein